MKPDLSSKYEAVIGLEVHCQLSTSSKIFCGCSTAFGAPPNSQTCPVCLGLPGALPVLNDRAVRYATLAALATHGTVHRRSVFARKNYFYPDLPKGYQISQYEEPLATDGFIEIDLEDDVKRVRIVRIHMEEDAGKSIHGSGGGSDSLVDLNRTGVPLIEIVSGPDMRTAEEAVAYLKNLHAIVTCLEVCNGNMEKGNFRCDANVSVRPRGQEALGTKVELKNLNSFRFVGKALEYEIKRQIAALEAGEEIRQQTRSWNQQQNRSEVMRDKEEAHDYRYFPEPDLKPLMLSEEELREARAALPELPRARAARFVREYEIPQYDAGVLTSSTALSAYFEHTAKASSNPKAASNWIMGELLGALNKEGLGIEQSKVRPEHLAELIRAIDQGEISGKIAKQVFAETYKSGEAPEKIIEARGLEQISDPKAIETMVDKVLSENPKAVSEYKAGKTKLMGFFVGKIMQASRGQANPRLVNELLGSKLKQ